MNFQPIFRDTRRKPGNWEPGSNSSDKLEIHELHLVVLNA